MSQQPRIGSHEFGRIEIGGQTYTSDAIIPSMPPAGPSGAEDRSQGRLGGISGRSADMLACAEHATRRGGDAHEEREREQSLVPAR